MCILIDACLIPFQEKISAVPASASTDGRPSAVPAADSVSSARDDSSSHAAAPSRPSSSSSSSSSNTGMNPTRRPAEAVLSEAADADPVAVGRKLFLSIDRNNDGVVSHIELIKALRSNQSVAQVSNEMFTISTYCLHLSVCYLSVIMSVSSSGSEAPFAYSARGRISRQLYGRVQQNRQRQHRKYFSG